MDIDISQFLYGLGIGMIVAIVLRFILIQIKKQWKVIHKIGLTNRDYIVLIIGCLIAIFGYVIDFKDQSVGGFMRGIGFGMLFAFVYKVIHLLITVKKSNNETT